MEKEVQSTSWEIQEGGEKEEAYSGLTLAITSTLVSCMAVRAQLPRGGGSASVADGVDMLLAREVLGSEFVWKYLGLLLQCAVLDCLQLRGRREDFEEWPVVEAEVEVG